MRAALERIPKDFDPGGGVTLVALRLSLLERDGAEGRRLLAASSHKRYNDDGLGGIAGTVDGYSFPRTWIEGLVARTSGEHETARRAFDSALKDVEADLASCADDAKAIMMLAMIRTALGHKEEAIRQGEAAVAMLPISRDAYDGPMLVTNLAAIYAQVGEKGRALDLLESLRGVPMGATDGTLRVEPEWDALRGDPRFEKLCSGGL